MTTVIVATAFGGPEVLSVAKEEVPAPRRGEVTIEVKAIGVNPVDYKLYSGLMGRDPDSLPLRVGQELAGVVTAVGPEAVGPAGPIRVGDEVIGYRRGVPGAYAGEVTWPAEAVVPKPAELSWEEASGLLLCGATALHALAATGVAQGDVVLVHGVSGGTGLAMAQLAALRGALVIGTASPARHESLRRYGIEPVAYGPGLADRIRALAPQGVDAAIDAAGTDEAIDVSLELVADEARIATIAAFQRAAEAGIKRLGAAPGADPGTEIRPNAWSQLVPLAAEGKLDVVIARTFPLEQAAQAHRLVATGHAGGKVVLLP
ncbi:NADP-dependent oxidoreductase [Streptomyces sp. NPDC054933]